MASTELAPPASSPDAGSLAGFKKKTLGLIGLVAAALWAFAIYTGSIVVMSIVGVLTAAVLGLLVYAWRLTRKQRGLIGLLEGAASSPEARRAAIAKLGAGKDSGEVVNVFARAQLEAGDDPARALETLEGLEWKRIPAQMQDDVALLKAQLYLQFGRPKEARPLVDQMNLDSAQRAQLRGVMVAVAGEAWARTGKAKEALALLASIDPAGEKDEQVRLQLRVARVFAMFAAGNKGGARADLGAIADVNVDYLGRFLLPRFKVHPELQKLARQVAERHPAVRRAQQQQQGGRRGRPR